MKLVSSKLAPWIAIFSLFLSTVLTLTHHHGSIDCGCESDSHQHSIVEIAGLENLAGGDCECTGCETTPHEHRHNPGDDHDDSCSICRMVYEHAVQAVEFSTVESDEPSFDFIFLVVSAPELEIVSGYLTRGPPALTA